MKFAHCLEQYQAKLGSGIEICEVMFEMLRCFHWYKLFKIDVQCSHDRAIEWLWQLRIKKYIFSPHQNNKKGISMVQYGCARY